MTPQRDAYTAGCNFYGSRTPKSLLEEFGGPLYVYNEALLRARCREMTSLCSVPGFTVCYSTKANANPHLLRIIREEGLHADAMSPGELAMLHRAGFTRNSICYVCNNVSPEELALANKEAAHVSVDSLSQLDSFGRVNPGARVMVRFNPGIGAGHHKKVVTAGKETKFGIGPDDFPAMREILAKHDLTLMGLNQHVGSLYMDPEPFFAAVDYLLETAREFPDLEALDFGGGFGIPYHKYEGQSRLDVAALSKGLTDRLSAFRAETGYTGRFIIEPGRYVAAECGLVLGSVYSVKNNGPIRFVGTDLGFSVLVRPMMYDAFHDVEVYPQTSGPRGEMVQTITGNICESGDIAAKDRCLPELALGDIIALLDAGAYGFAMSSPYNQRTRPAEVLIEQNGSARLIRRRETVEDLFAALP